LLFNIKKWISWCTSVIPALRRPNLSYIAGSCLKKQSKRFGRGAGGIACAIGRTCAWLWVQPPALLLKKKNTKGKTMGGVKDKLQ
jgi:hypothetical protein